MMAARSLEIADELADRIAALVPTATVSREFNPKIDDADFAAWIAAVKPMGIFIIPIGKESVIRTRASDQTDYRYGVIFAEKYTGEGIPTKVWMDERIGTVDTVEGTIGDARNEWLLDDSRVTPQASEITLIFDPDAYRVNTAFWSIWNLTLRENARVRAPRAP